MKKTSFLLFAFIIAFSFSSCKSEKSSDAKKEEVITEVKKSVAAFSVANAEKLVTFTAYKTTDKVPVGGQFNTIDVISGGEGASVTEAINNTEFSIPVSSIFTKDTSRDFKIRKFFFGVMENTKLLSGKLMITDETNGVAEIKMNGVTEKLPFTYTITDKTFNMKAVMDVTNWKATSALESLNEICKDLHKGADGVSKTWSEVAIDITTTF